MGGRGFWSQSVTDDEYRERLKSRCEIMPNGCWEYRGFIGTFGYGQFSYRGETWITHRISWHLSKGPIPSGMQVLHRCDVRHCCNPEHFFLGTNRDNMMDKMAKGRHHYTTRNHCGRGHEYTPENTYHPPKQPSKRVCKKCEQIKERVRWGWPRELAEKTPTLPPGHVIDFETGNIYPKGPKQRKRPPSQLT